MTRHAPWLLLLSACGAPAGSMLAAREDIGAAFLSGDGKLNAEIDATGARLDAVGAPSAISLRLTGWTSGAEWHAGAPEAVVERACPPALGPDCQAVGLRGEGIEEWWSEANTALEHGFDVLEAGTGDVRIEVAVDGARVEETAAGLRFVPPAGRALRYEGLHATDADGADLPATMVPAAGGFRIDVDARGARFPVEVDPIVLQEMWTYTSEGETCCNPARTAELGDIDGDGTPELAAAYPSSGGKILIFPGTAAGPDSRPAQLVTETAGEGYFAYGMAVTDVNGDDFADLVAGELLYDSTARTGAMFVYYGSAAGLSTVASESHLASVATDGSVLIGYTIAALGDTDGDGFNDVAVDAKSTSGSSDEVQIYRGSASGLETTASVTLHAPIRDGSFGTAIRAGCDFNQDGYPELLVGDPDYNGWDGAVCVFTGSAAGLGTTCDTLLAPGVGNQFGETFSNCADVDGDGYPDVLIGAPDRQSPHTTAYAFLYRGSAAGIRTSASTSYSSTEPGDEFGTGLALADVDGDGYADGIIGAPLAASGGTTRGRIAVYPGGPAGLSRTADADMAGTREDGELGGGIVGLGDLDDDGADDVLIGEYGRSTDYMRVTMYTDGPDEDADGSIAYFDCDDTSSVVHPGATEVCDGADNDCDGRVDIAAVDVSVYYLDADHDGYGVATSTTTGCSAPAGYASTSTDCDDSRPDAHPGSAEVPYDGVDQDCSGADLADVDADGYISSTVSGGTDCDDTRSSVHPGGIEVAYDGLDQDCAGGDLIDVDRDTYASTAVGGTDCNDATASVHPGASEVPYDGIDQDCTGADMTDVDFDGHTAVAAGGDDCNDNDYIVHPGARETAYDGIDQDCSGADLIDVDGDSFASTAVSGGTDCNDGSAAIYPGAHETPYDGIDQDCVGGDLIDADGDGHAAIGSGGDDPDDTNGTVYPGAPEVPYDGIDQNGDGRDVTDVDGDGHDAAVVGGDDCDDTSAAVNPDETEVAYDGIDQDCAGGDLDDVDRDGSPSVLVAGGTDCDDSNAAVSPSAAEVPYDGIDNDCVDGDLTDVDGDGHSASSSGGDDPNDADPSVYPGAAEIPYDGIDQNGDGSDLTDVDGDGHDATVVGGDDCDDSDAAVSPDEEEVPYDGIDNDCLDGDLTDVDGDGHSASGSGGDDPDDADPTVYPGATEIPYDGIDQNGDGTDLTDVDGDGHDATVVGGDDCDDDDATTYPGAPELADGLDNDCDEAIDEGTPDLDDDGDGLTNSEEATYNTDPEDPDSDDDDVPDGDEIDDGTLPNSPDTDEDGLDDGDEKRLKTDPLRMDSDGDSLTDGFETPDPQNPPDSDRDSMIDPLDADDDNDGIPTSVEAGSSDNDIDGDGLYNWLDEDSDGDGIDDSEDKNPTIADQGCGCSGAPGGASNAAGALLLAALLIRRRR